MTDVQNRTTEGEKLRDASSRFIARRRLMDERPEERDREVAAFVSGWNACMEALQDG